MRDEDKRAVLGMIPYGLYVVGVGRGEGCGAYVANWISQASFKPPLLMLGVLRKGRQHGIIESERALAVSFLASDQKDLASRFLRFQAADGGRLSGLAFTAGRATGAPVLDEAPGFVECRVRQIVAGGDHDVVLAEVVEAGWRRAATPLMLSDTSWSYAG